MENIMKYPASNYKQIRTEIKSAHKQQIENHSKSKRLGLTSFSSYQSVRIQHIAYSMFKGHTFEQVEGKWREPDSSVNHYIKRQALALYDSYMKRIVVAQDAVEVTA
jgi:hypothetical protein